MGAKAAQALHPAPRKLANWRWGWRSETSRRRSNLRRLLQAKDPRDVVALHTDYVNSQIAALAEQGKEPGEQVAKMDPVPSVDLRIVLTHGVRNPQNTGGSNVFLCIAIFLLQCIKMWCIGVG
jgi:Phasin protein